MWCVLLFFSQHSLYLSDLQLLLHMVAEWLYICRLSYIISISYNLPIHGLCVKEDCWSNVTTGHTDRMLILLRWFRSKVHSPSSPKTCWKLIHLTLLKSNETCSISVHLSPAFFIWTRKIPHFPACLPSFFWAAFSYVAFCQLLSAARVNPVFFCLSVHARLLPCSSTLPACLKSKPPPREEGGSTEPRSILTHRVLRFTDEVTVR